MVSMNLPRLLSNRSRALWVVALCTVCAVSLPLGAQQPERVLHELFNLPDSSELRRRGAAGQGQSAAGDASDPSTHPRARTPGQPPPLSLGTRPDEPVLGTDGPRSPLPEQQPQGGLDPSSAQNALDRDTDKVDELNYFASFDPSVIPLKRGVAQNKVIAVGGEPVFVVEPGRLTSLAIGPDRERGGEAEDIFWGSFLIHATGGGDLPVPSVAPIQRVLAIESEPAVSLGMVRDEAGNHYLRVPSSHRGMLRVNVKLAAPRSYFGGEFEGEPGWDAFPSDLVTPIPAFLRQSAIEVSDELGLGRWMGPRAVLDQLVEHFRGFSQEQMPTSMQGTDTYRAVTLGKVGVCRHRAFAFVITASALGLPARYVYNEAHAFVEVYWPKMGWRRIDLGGAANDFMMRAAEAAQRVHDAGSDDALPTPASYLKEIEASSGARAAAGEIGAPDAARATGDDAEAGSGAVDIEPGPQSESLDRDDPPNGSVSGQTEPGDADAAPSDERDTRRALTIQLGSLPPSLQRGQPFLVSGDVSDDRDRALPERTVRVMLTAPAGLPAQGREIGRARTDATGHFESEVVLPPDVSIGRWSLHVVYEGDDDHLPAQSP